MQIELSSKEFRSLLDLVYIGNWILNSTRGEERFTDYDEVESLLFARTVLEGMPGMAELYQGQIIPSRAFAEGGIHEAIAEYENNVFCYVGGLSVWQCFPETVAFYKSIEDKIPNAEFRVFTPDVDKAIQIMEEFGLKRYSAKFVKSDELSKELAECKFGFILRAKSPVNYVATPTKLSNYLASGLIPIVSDSVEYFNEILKDCKYAVILSENSDTKKVIDLALQKAEESKLFIEYSEIFNKYYNDEYHAANISKKISDLKF